MQTRVSELTRDAQSSNVVWGRERMMVAGFMLACLGEVGLIGSSAQ